MTGTAIARATTPQATVDMPPLTRELSFVPGTWNDKERTVEVIWSTGVTVERYRFIGRDDVEVYDEALSLDPQHVRMARLQNGAPVLNNHRQWGSVSENVIGVVEKAWLAGGEGRALVRLSGRDDLAGLRRDIADGILRKVSVGYRVYELEEVEPEKRHERGRRSMRAVDWEPMEISFVAVPADDQAQARSAPTIQTNRCQIRSAQPAQPTTRADQSMESTAPTPPAAPAASTPAAPAASADGARAASAAPVAPAPGAPAQMDAGERSLLAHDLCRKHKLPAEFERSLLASNDDANAIRAKVLDKVAEASSDEVRGNVAVLVDEREKVRSAVSAALMHRAFPQQHKLTPEARDLRGLNLRELAREGLERQGVRTRGMSPNELSIRALHSTSDFPLVLADVANKSMLMGYQAAPRTFLPFCRQVNAPDFKDVHRVRLGEFPKLEKVNQSGEFKSGSLSETEEKYRLATYGKIVGINRQVIINDDLGAFTRIPQGYGWAAADLESDTVWGVITANANMSDAVALFHATHANLQTGGGSALSLTSLSTARAAMMKQKALDGKKFVMVVPKFLIVPAALLTTAEQLTTQITAAAAGDVVPCNEITSGMTA